MIVAGTCRHCGTKRRWTQEGNDGLPILERPAACPTSPTKACEPRTPGERMSAAIAEGAQARARGGRRKTK